ncbi:P-loop containing nucleoside triphosphate hydrolase protein [Vararia minispora EC-137]|uniref:P-loop containing nucleoside triphosphate hydrolase protein n=1 Tax=Vararia minispora EC-137 TaxID=1314806 RepID=A0ACB8Q7E4_9AGAM|nr:P-loop containing nucleoside triphosphate hydrolase protein [Vararia minispora EC-137]
MHDSNKSDHGKRLHGSRYAQERKKLLGFANALRAFGFVVTKYLFSAARGSDQGRCRAQAIIDVPRVVVIGNQSAGKSSVVEAISGITVPRDAGTCTRCPMECRMASSMSPSWQCQVSIRWEFDESGCVQDKVIEVPFGDIITDKDEVELALRRAQFAVLNPDIEVSHILSLTTTQIRQGIAGHESLSFSRNVVCVDLQGPEMADLSFIDLPGLIQVADDPQLVRLVESLVVEHIKGNSLILVTIPMPDDLENQKALTLAREADPEGRRTIGVLTKADAVPKGSRARDLWLEVIEGRNAKKSLLHGYFATRQPDDDERERGTTPAEARRAEARFFETSLPWSKSSHKNRFGITKLVETISPLLERVIKQSLPKINGEANDQLRHCDHELSILPVVVEKDAMPFMFELITRFVNDVAKCTDGSDDKRILVQESREVYRAFKSDIRRTAPPFVPQVRKGELSEDDQDAPDMMLSINAEDCLYLDGMRTHIQKSLSRQLPGNVPFDAKHALIVDFQNSWTDSANKCLTNVVALTKRALLACVDAHFSQWTLLRNHVRACVEELVELTVKESSHFLWASLQCELTAYTQNTHYLQTCKDRWLSRYRDMRLGNSPQQVDQDVQNELFAVLAKAGRPGLGVHDLARLNEPDKFDTEMEVMAEVRGYFQVAYKRVIDVVPMLIDLTFLYKYAQIARLLRGFRCSNAPLG